MTLITEQEAVVIAGICIVPHTLMPSFVQGTVLATENAHSAFKFVS